MKYFLGIIKKYNIFLFIVADICLIFLSAFLAFLLRFDGIIPSYLWRDLYAFSVMSVFFTIPVFLFYKIYRVSWKFVSITDLPNIFSAVLVPSFMLGAALFILRDQPFFSGFPRSVIFLYTILMIFFVCGLRFLKRIYWQIIRVEGRGVKIKEFSLPITSATLNGNIPKRILITGGAGYVGSVLTRQLLADGYNVRVLDKLLFGSGPIKELGSNNNFQFIQGDIFDKEVVLKAISDVDAVVHLAAIVGEPACVCQKEVALKTNYLGAIYVARLCKAMGVKIFVQASTCSTYGKNEEKLLAKENSKLFPVDFYGETKIYAERELMKLADEDFNPTILRFSTIYGLSPRMRFDLVVNTLTKKAVKDKEITIFGGNQWRPLLHVSDAARAICQVLKLPVSKTANQIFNVGNNNENYTISKLGDLVKECVPDVKIKTINGIDDERDYRVDFTKIEKVLGFKTKKTVKDGIIEMRDAIKRGDFPDTENKIYYNHLI